MRAMLLDHPGRPLRLAELPRRAPGPGELLIRVRACGV
jgi:propanol-preferring alcohol dehydrogenase